MQNNHQTLYLWDLADTLFGEVWDRKKSGFPSYDAYVQSLGYNLQTISPKAYELNYKIPYTKSLMRLTILPGFKQALSWTKHNAIFTTGNRRQHQWRAERFLKKGQLDIRPFLKKLYSTFDYGNTNHKTVAMYRDIIKKQFGLGFTAVVYADNNIKNCEMFLAAAKHLTLPAKLQIRCYHINKSLKSTRRLKKNFFGSPGLFAMLKNEKLGFS